MVAAAVIGTVASAAATAYAGNKAANATKSASNAAISEQQQALQQQAALSQPYRDFGQSAIPALQSLLGLSGPTGPTTSTGATSQPMAGGAGTTTSQYTLGGAGQIGQQLVAGGAPASGVPTPTGLGAPVLASGASPTGGAAPSVAGGLSPGLTAAGPPVDPRLAALQSTPGYQFTQQQGTQAALNAATAQGLGLSGNTLEALSNYNAGLADQTYQQTIGNLQNAVGVGQAAAAGQAANIGNAANNISNTLYNQGQTQAGIDVNTVAGITKAIGNGVNQYTLNNTLKGLSNPGGTGVSTDPTASINYNYGPGSVGTTTNFEDPGFGIGTTTNFEGP